MWVCIEVGVTPARVRNMGIELRRAQVSVAEHLLHRAQIGASFEQVGGKGMAQQVRVDSGGIEAGLSGQSPEDEEGTRPGERAALRVQEELRSVPAVEVRAAAREVPAHRLDPFPSKGDDALLVALAETPDDPVLEVDAASVEAHGLAHAEPRSVEKLDERAVAKGARRRPVCGLNEPLDLTRGKRARQTGATPRKIELGGGVVLAPAEQEEMVVEGAGSCCAPGDRGRGLTASSEVGEPGL